MKFNKYSIIAFALSAVMIFAGCEFQGTKAKFKGDEETDYNATYRSVVLPGTVEIYNRDDLGNPIGVGSNAGEYTPFSFLIVSNGALNEDSIEDACNFYSVAKNETDPLYFYPVISSTPLSKKLYSIDVVVKPENNDGTTLTKNYNDIIMYNLNALGYYNDEVVLTMVTYNVEASQVTTNKIALIVDATTLKEKSKAYVLNFDGNDECGEDSDSIIKFYDVNNAGGTLTDIPPSSCARAESWCYAPTFDFAPANFTVETNADGLQYLHFECGAPAYSEKSNFVYGDKLADVINQIYSYRFLPIGEKKWQSVPVNVTYNKDTHVYEANSDPIPLGTKYGYGYEGNNKATWDDAAKSFGGIAPRLSYKKDSENFAYLGIAWSYTTEPDYIITDPDARDTTNAVTVTLKPAPYITDSAIQTVQAGILDYAFLSNGIIKISINDNFKDNYNIRFGATDGFVITVRNHNSSTGYDYAGDILDSKVINTSETEVSIQLDNQYYDMSDSTLMIWVGYDTTIKANKLYPKQTHFGCLGADLDELYFAMPGYVCIN